LWPLKQGQTGSVRQHRSNRKRRAAITLLVILTTTVLARVQAGSGAVSTISAVSMSGPTRFAQTDGAGLYQAICQGCHMPNAEGAVGAGAYPALAHDQKLVSAVYPVYTVLKGRKAMPSFASYLSDAQVAALVTYVRTHFGNDYEDPVTPAMVHAIRMGH
jgi:mono/diheme cytochrome c family protein